MTDKFRRLAIVIVYLLIIAFSMTLFVKYVVIPVMYQVHKRTPSYNQSTENKALNSSKPSADTSKSVSKNNDISQDNSQVVESSANSDSNSESNSKNLTQPSVSSASTKTNSSTPSSNYSIDSDKGNFETQNSAYKI